MPTVVLPLRQRGRRVGRWTYYNAPWHEDDVGAGGPLTSCGCREPYPSSSGYGAVLVNQPGNNIGSLHVFRFGIGDRDDHFGDR